MRESLDPPVAPETAIRAHLSAMMKNVSTYARAARQLGVVDEAAFGESLDRLKTFLETSDIFGILKDFQAEALYNASVELTAAYTVAMTGEHDDAWIKASFARVGEALRKYWISMGKSERN
jgi:hypothetical protein